MASTNFSKGGPHYTSLEHQAGLDNKSSAHSSVSELRPFEQDKSSRTAIQDKHNNGVLAQQLGHPWQPGFWKQFPWLGVLALVNTVIATFACVAVLIKSEGVPIEVWEARDRFQPTVFISICTAIANITLTYALYDGVVISFWRRAGRGTTLRELHQYWHSGMSVWGAFRGIFRMQGKVTALACIIATASIARGPLFQRASSVKNIITETDGNLTIYSASRLPLGYAGRDSGRSMTPSYMNPNFTDIYQAHANRDDIPGTWTGCEASSTCYTSIKGFGFGVSCNTTELPYNLYPETFSNGSVAILPPLEVFTSTAWQLLDYNHGYSLEDPTRPIPYTANLLLNATFMGTPTDEMNGTLTSHTCALRGGILSYPVQITNATLTLQSPSWQNDTFLEESGLEPLPYNAASNIAGFILAAKGLYEGTATYQFGGGAGWILNLTGASANRYLARTNPGENTYVLGNNITWRDPMDDMINSMREIAFRSSLLIARDNTTYPNATQLVSSRMQTPRTVYTANYRYMAAAVALSLLGVIAVIPTYHGFWELGGPVSMSPLEIAKAFNAPILRGAEGNQLAEDMLHIVGRTKVRYGDSGVAVNSGGEEMVRRIEIGPVVDVRPPEKGVKYM